VEPRPGVLATRTVPPSSVTRRWTTCRPRPTPKKRQGHRAVGLPERIEDARQRLAADVDTGVGDGELDALGVRPTLTATSPRASPTQQADCE